MGSCSATWAFLGGIPSTDREKSLGWKMRGKKIYRLLFSSPPKFFNFCILLWNWPRSGARVGSLLSNASLQASDLREKRKAPCWPRQASRSGSQSPLTILQSLDIVAGFFFAGKQQGPRLRKAPGCSPGAPALALLV